MKALKRKVPELRFPDFSDDWIKRKLGDLVAIKSGVSPSIYEFAEEGKYPFLKVEELNNCQKYQEVSRFYANESYNLIESYSVIFPKRGAAILNNKVRINSIPVLMDSNLMAIFPKVSDIFFEFLFYAIIKEELYKIADTSSIPQINNKHIEPYEILIPSLQEQTKIASFLSAVDNKIHQITLKKELLEQYKKGVMQKIFSREIRFKDKDGKDYPEWEETQLGKVSENVSYGMNSAAVPFDGENKYLRITDIDEESHLFKPNPLTTPEGEIEEKYVLKKGDILFARTGASVGKSYIYREEDGKLLFAGFLIKFSITSAEPYFIYYWTLTVEYKKWIQLMSMRSGQPGINAEEYKSFSLKIPVSNEQRKIASFLSSIDQKISLVTTQLEKMQTWKKGLLQQMFV